LLGIKPLPKRKVIFFFLSGYKMSSQQIHLKKLDSLRGLASLYVVLHNLVYGLYGLNLISEGWKLFFFAGQEAVMLFFILSGFVIYLSTHQKNLDFRSFFVRRFRRIYFPFVLSILLSILIFYFNGNLADKFSWKELLGNLLLLQDFGRVKPGNWFSPFLGNLPLWSLSYEWWFYMLFYPLYKFLPKSKRLYIILAFSAASYLIYTAYPNHICLVGSYLIIWWCGVELATCFCEGKFSFKQVQIITISLSLMMFLSLLPILQVQEIKFGVYPFLVFRHFSAALLMIWVGFFWYQHNFYCFDRLLGIFAKLAPISYAIYIFHFPILVQLNLTPIFNNFYLEYFLKSCLLFSLAYITEIKLQPVINRWLK
jgi:peptidoglycan/LPS O-acetylase OafA/YrhL